MWSQLGGDSRGVRTSLEERQAERRMGGGSMQAIAGEGRGYSEEGPHSLKD